MRVEDVLRSHGVGVGGSGVSIKSKQTGEIMFSTSSVNSLLIDISEVDLDKAIIMLTTRSGGTSYTYQFAFKAKFIANNKLEIKRASGGSGAGQPIVSWTVFELEHAKSIQSGESVLTSSPLTVPISTVDPQKTMVFFSNTTTNATNSAMLTTCDINQDELVFKNIYGAIINWHLVEFK